MDGVAVAGADPAKDEWVQRVFGINVGSGGAEQASQAGSATEKILPIWLEAKESVGEMISKLQSSMRDTKHPLLMRVADQGLNGVTQRLQVGLQVALTECDRGSPENRPKALEQAKAAIAGLRSFLESDPVVPLLENNPFKVPVTLRPTLGAALDSLETALRR